MKTLRLISLWTLGLFFILSGFAKAVDPSGGASQITDYMYAFHIDFLKVFAYFLSISLAAAEFVIGMHLILRFRINIVAWPALVMMVFFTILTFIILVFNPVSDCGCFGEAFKLTHWETFIKNLVLLPMSYLIFKGRHELTSPVTGFMGWCLSGFQVAFILSVSFIALYDAPIFDFRPFKVGVNIPKAMSIPAGAEQPEYDTRFILEKDGVKKEFGVSDYPYTDSTWVFVSSNTITLKEGYEPPITDFHVTDIDNVEKNHLLYDEKPVFVALSPRLSEMDTDNAGKLVRLGYLAKEKGYHFYCLTNSTNEEIATFDHKWGARFDYLITDYRVIRTISRANPGLMLLSNGGTIIGKWNFNRIDNIQPFEEPVAAALDLERNRTNRLMLFACAMLLIAGTSIFYRYKS